MIKRLGATGIVGLVAIIGGIALIAYHSPIAAAGIALVLAGFGLVVRALVSSLINSMGMGGMF